MQISSIMLLLQIVPSHFGRVREGQELISKTKCIENLTALRRGGGDPGEWNKNGSVYLCLLAAIRVRKQIFSVNPVYSVVKRFVLFAAICILSQNNTCVSNF